MLVIPVLRWGLRLAILLLVGWGFVLEMRSSTVQSAVFSRLARDMTFTVQPGPNRDMRFPTSGPYDERLGYTQLSSFIEQLGSHYFFVERQATLAPPLETFVRNGGYAIYHEKAQAGITLLDRAGKPLYSIVYPRSIYDDFQSVPPIVANTLLYIEDRHLFDLQYPRRNPAVAWSRFLRATADRFGGRFGSSPVHGGASTLATQIEKFQHSPGGRTSTIGEKLRQMLTASMRTYLDGPDTTQARRRIVVTYLNSTPLGSRAGYGEIIGIGDGLSVWYGTDFAEANRILSEPTATAQTLTRKAEIYKEVLSLLLAERRPSYYLSVDRGALEVLTDRYLRLLKAAGLINPGLFDAALGVKLHFRPDAPVPESVSFTGRKAVDSLRTELLSVLPAPNLYSLDRMDLTVRSTIDNDTQARVTSVLDRLGDRNYVKSLGLIGQNLLGPADPSEVVYSVMLYERGADRNYVRVHADSLDEPFDINTGAKLILGSTAKLRTVITYLGIITELHGFYGPMSLKELRSASSKARDPLTTWATDYLVSASDRSLQAMLDTAMQRRYSASPHESFFTGGGIHNFHNFEKADDSKVPTVEEAMQHSINLAFIRLMRDISRYYIAQDDRDMNEPDVQGHGAAREAYLRRFADQEGRVYLNRFYDDYHGLTPDEAMTLLASRARLVPSSLSVIFRTVRPQATVSDLYDFLLARSRRLLIRNVDVATLYTKYAIDRYSLADRGYLAGVHPLELWLVSYLQSHPGARRSEVLAASTAERQEVYGWLFKTHSAHKQDVRIKILREEDAFNQILQDWRRQGYPFGQLVPSLATAIGSSGDRPGALAHLIGIILNDGMGVPSSDIERLSFAAKTPFETDLAASAPSAPTRVLAPEVALTVRRALMGVVDHGTGMRLRNAYLGPDGKPIEVGGKTGTGDNRFESFGVHGNLIDSRTVDRTATFVFFLGDRFFGTVTAYVPGREAAKYHFTSALTVQLLKSLAPQIQPLIDAPAQARAWLQRPSESDGP